ncbi:MAG: hypothetical protein JSV44_03025, partial [Candidatus Zixiibacteriota bacterium]
MKPDRLLEGDTSYVEHYDFGNSNPTGFVFSPDGKYLYGSSYYTGVSNIFRYDLDADSMDAVSNCETGLFHPIALDSDSLYAFRYTGKGFVPVLIDAKPLEDISATRYLGTMIAQKYPAVQEWMIESPSEINLDSMTLSSQKYHPLAHIRLVSLYPIVEGYKHYTAVGMRANFAGPILIHKFDVAASYTPSGGVPDGQKWHVTAEYTHMNWSTQFKYNTADFYDLFGPTRTSRKGYSLGLQYEKSLIYDEPRLMDLHFSLTGYGGLERLPDYQNVVASYDKLLSSGLSLSYSNQKASLGAVDYEKGISWQFSTSGNYVNDEFYPLLHTEFDAGLSLFYHSSLWLRSSAGYSPGEHNEPFANFFFGGFGNNWLDYRYEKRYREYYAFPGTDLNAISGTNYGKLVFEWALPPLRFRRLGGSALYCSWARLALFSMGIITNLDNGAHRRKVGSLGAQLDFRFQLLSHLRLTLSAGYAGAFEKGRRPIDEFMISLKLL